MAKTNNAPQTIIAAGTSNAAGATTRSAIDVRTADGGRVTIKLTNAAAPTVQAEARILISHTEGATPATAAAGVDWKTIYRVGGGVLASAVTEQTWVFGPDVRHIEVEVTGNTGQAVACEAIASTFTY